MSFFDRTEYRDEKTQYILYKKKKFTGKYFVKFDTLNIITSVKNGIITRYLELFPDGTIKMRGRYSADRKNGLWTEYYPSGNVKSEKKFNLNTPKEWWFYYSEEGKQNRIEIYADGKIVTIGTPVYEDENTVTQSRYYDVSTTFYDAVSGKALYRKKERHFTEKNYVFQLEYTEL